MRESKNPGLAHLLFKELEKLHSLEASFGDKIIELERLLTKLFVELTKDDNIQFTTMFARIAFVAHEYKISAAMQWHIHHLRKKKQTAFVDSKKLTESDYLHSLKTAAFVISTLLQTQRTEELNALLPDTEEYVESEKVVITERLESIRVMVLDYMPKEERLVCKHRENPAETILVQYNITNYNENYNPTIQQIKRDFNNKVTLHLIDVAIDEEGIYRPKAFVIEPDYMIDVSAISECFQAFGVFEELYLLKKFLPFTYSVPLMLGNVANFFLDELMTDSNVNFTDTFPKVFSLNPLAFATFEDREVMNVYHKSQKHFTNLKTIVTKTLSETNIPPEDCYLEPSFFSEKYGIQGRLDIWYKDPNSDRASIIELKSGSPFMANRFGLSNNHYTQTILYDLLVRSVYGNAVDPSMYILYSGLDFDNLKYAPPLKVQQDEAIKLRNTIVSFEKNLADLDLFQLDKSNILDSICSEKFPEIKGYVASDIQAFAKTIRSISLLERLYFLSFVSFTAREQQLAKTGLAGKDINGLASLWLSDYDKKNEAFEVLGFLKVTESRASEDNPIINFQRTEATNELANFRQGDIIVLYPYLKEGDNALTNQMFKGSIANIDAQKVSVQLHSKQFNDKLFKQNISWHIERDMMETGFRAQYAGLYAFLNAPQHQKDLLLTVKAPKQTKIKPLILGNPNLSAEQSKVLHKAIAAKDYFLLVGPPGTGKTKFMLAEMVRYLLTNTQEQILLLAYTNRAVDEICEAIHEFAEKDYLRIGSRYSTDSRFHHRLFSVQTEEVKRRDDLRKIIDEHRIFVATVASIAGKSSLLEMKKFNTTIIDEASQILEPLLVGMLPLFERFVLIGDHKQLPAVVLQDKNRSAAKEEALHEIGLHNRRNSLFERLYNQAVKNGWDWAYDMLSHQGRMHSDICRFPSHYFYDNKLNLLPEELPISAWQKEDLNYKLPSNSNTLMELLAKNRMLFFNCEPNRFKNPKTNINEAQLVGEIVANFDAIYKASGLEFKPEDIGVITPFRAQIAQIRHVLTNYELGYENCTIDTVERYQGGAREIIIISLCLNNMHQLDSIISLSDDEQVDRKLNVALTRARKHLVLVGNEDLMRLDKRYAALIDWIENNKIVKSE